MYPSIQQSPTAMNGTQGRQSGVSPNFDGSGFPFLSPGAVSHDSGLTFDDYNNNSRFRELQTELRSLLFTGAQSAGASREESPEAEQGYGPGQRDTRQPGTRMNLYDLLRNSSDQIPVQTKIQYLHGWATECAPWLDMFDQSRHFGLTVPVLAQSSQAVLSAMLAVAARQQERKRGAKGASLDSLEFYSQAISSLTMTFKAREPDVLTTACLLCVLEMMSANPRDWRRHLDGCAALFQASGVNGFCGGFDQAIFWCYARMDLCEAIIADQTESTVLPIDKWVVLPQLTSPMSISNTFDTQSLISDGFLEQGRAIPDMHANYAVYLCAKACDLLSRRTRYLEMGDENGCDEKHFERGWLQHWNELQLWYNQRPPEMIAARVVAGTDETHQFPQIFFSHWAAISSNQLFHTACILLMNSKPNSVNLHSTNLRDPQHASNLWHARQVVGISATNPHPGCLNNAIQPLYVAGRLFSHSEEQRQVVKLLNHIEQASGWGSRWRIADLEAEWGLPRGSFS